MANLTQLSARACGVISAQYDADDSQMAYSALDLTAFGFQNRDVIVGDELGFKGVPVGLLCEDVQTEEIHEIYRGTRVIANGPNEWKVDAEAVLATCPFVPGAKSHLGFTSTAETFRLLSGRPFPVPQYVDGHSLAAAWALLRGTKVKASVISFAGPRVFDRAGADAAVQAIPNLLRWVHHSDIVPKVPVDLWPFFGFIHAGPATEFDSAAKIRGDLSFTDTIAAWHNIHTYWNAVDPTHPLAPQFARTT